MRHDTSPLQAGLAIGERIVHGEDFETDFVEALARLFKADAGVGLTRWRQSPSGIDSIDVTVASCPPLSPEYLDSARAVAATHPGITAMARSGTRHPVRLSDVVRLSRFWGTDVFTRMHGHVPDARYPMSALLSLSRTEMVFVGLHRTDRDFSDKDVSDLAAVQQVIAAAWRYRTTRSAALAELEAPATAQSRLPAPIGISGAAITVREAQVLDLLVHGWTNNQIGLRLGITERTVRKHLTAVYAKAALEGRAATAAWWQRQRSRQRNLGG